jgi:prepilin-type processing-associated H-X9-DG protein
MPEGAIKEPSDTLLFGERVPMDHHYMDLLQGEGNDLDMIDMGRHNNRGNRQGAGGANYAFCDGSVRYLRGDKSINPINRWAVTDEWRTNTSSINLGSGGSGAD